VDDIPVEKLQIHDVPVDIICTPTQVIFKELKYFQLSRVHDVPVDIIKELKYFQLSRVQRSLSYCGDACVVRYYFELQTSNSDRNAEYIGIGVMLAVSVVLCCADLWCFYGGPHASVRR
jgi:hypothetical protein